MANDVTIEFLYGMNSPLSDLTLDLFFTYEEQAESSFLRDVAFFSIQFALVLLPIPKARFLFVFNASSSLP